MIVVGTCTIVGVVVSEVVIEVFTIGRHTATDGGAILVGALPHILLVLCSELRSVTAVPASDGE